MSLSCSWDEEWDGESEYFRRREDFLGNFIYMGEAVFDIEFFRPLWTKRSRKCKSCGSLIKPGETCVEFERFRGCVHEIEFRIYDEAEGVPLASWFLCEKCGEINANLSELNYCVYPNENMEELLEEYRQDQKNKMEES